MREREDEENLCRESGNDITVREIRRLRRTSAVKSKTREGPEAYAFVHIQAMPKHASMSE
jgi:hypothetical protein